MKVKFLGTSHGVPLPGRHCQSILIETEKGDYLIDAGAPVMDLLVNKDYDMTRLKAVFISHCHPDHFFELVHMVDLASWYYKEMQYSVFMPEQRGIDAVRAFCGTFHNLTDRIRYELVTEGTFFDDSNIKVTAFHTEHMRASTNIAFGYLIEADGKRICITGDLHASLEDFPTTLLAEHTDVLVTECAHFPAEALIEKLKNVNADRIMVVHVFPTDRYDTLKALEGEITGRTVLYPNDGDEYSV